MEVGPSSSCLWIADDKEVFARERREGRRGRASGFGSMAEGGSMGERRENEETLFEMFMERFFMFRTERGLCWRVRGVGEGGGDGDGEESELWRTIREDGSGGTTRRAVGGPRLECMSIGYEYHDQRGREISPGEDKLANPEWGEEEKVEKMFGAVGKQQCMYVSISLTLILTLYPPCQSPPSSSYSHSHSLQAYSSTPSLLPVCIQFFLVPILTPL